MDPGRASVDLEPVNKSSELLPNIVFVGCSIYCTETLGVYGFDHDCIYYLFWCISGVIDVDGIEY